MTEKIALGELVPCVECEQTGYLQLARVECGECGGHGWRRMRDDERRELRVIASLRPVHKWSVHADAMLVLGVVAPDGKNLRTLAECRAHYFDGFVLDELRESIVDLCRETMAVCRGNARAADEARTYSKADKLLARIERDDGAT